MDNSKENIEAILAEFAKKICSAYGIMFVGGVNGGYKIHLEDEMVNDTVMIAGNPVIIKIHWRLFADSMHHNKLVEFKHHLQRCLEIADSRMLYTLSNNPISPILAKDQKDKYWKKKQILKQVMPNLIDHRRVTYEVHIRVTAHDRKTGVTVTFKGDEEEGATIEALKQMAHKELTKEILNERARSIAEHRIKRNIESTREGSASVDGSDGSIASTVESEETRSDCREEEA